jgi:branched-chain amino acid transport system permease protein
LDAILVAEQALNGLQLGVMLFLIAAGLTLVFGIMNFVNLAHGSLYMIGAFAAASALRLTGSFALAVLSGLAAATLTGFAIEAMALRKLYLRDHLDQVLGTFGLLLFFNEAARIVWGNSPLYMSAPDVLSGFVNILPGTGYPAYRLAIMAVGLLVGAWLFLLISRTRLGMLIRAGAANRAHCVACRDRLLITRRHGDRCNLAAHFRNLFYHDHPGLRPNALLPRRRTGHLWRR